MTADAEIFVIGAGPAGLTAAYCLTKETASVIVIEKDPVYVGGISRTVSYNGFLFDIGGHRFFSKAREVVDLWQEILPDDFIERPRLSRIFYGGKYYSYPLNAFEALANLGILRSAACMLSFAYAKAFPIKDARTFHQWVRNQFGEKLFSIFFKTYTEKVWGMSCDDISADWAAQRIKGLDLPGQGALLLALATPAVFVSAVGGQNGTWTAALFGGGLGLLERRPLLAGGLLGLLVYKPQLGLLIPAALLAGRHWRAFMSASVVAGGLLAVSAIWFGTDVWAGYLRNLGVLRQMILEDDTGVWHRFVSVFVSARRLGAPVEMAYAIQIVTGALACAAVAWVWFGKAPAGVKNAMLVLGTCLATPYVQDYDLVVGALVVAWLWQSPVPSASEPPLHISAGLVLLLPLVAAALAHMTGLAFGPLFIAPLFVVALRMNFHAQAWFGTPPTVERSR